MKQLFFLIVCSFCIPFLFAGCGKHSKSEKELMTAAADSFANAYYNFKFEKALVLCDSDSRKAIYFFCSNLTEEDMNVVRKAPQGASVTISDADCDEDTAGSVVVTANDFFRKDSIGTTGTIIKEESYRLPLKKVNGQWTVLFTHKQPIAQ